MLAIEALDLFHILGRALKPTSPVLSTNKNAPARWAVAYAVRWGPSGVQ